MICPNSGHTNLVAIPLKLREANELVARWHRHSKPVVGARFAIGARVSEELVGAVIVGRPVARMLDDGFTAEATRLVSNGHPNACSFLYAAAWRAWRAMGGTRLVTYTRADETGASLTAAGWRVVYQTKARDRGWDTPSRPRMAEAQPAKTLWEAT